MAIHIFYIHGFNSSPQSAKAQVMGRFLAQHYPDYRYHVPELPFSPEGAVDILCRAIEPCLPETVYLLGSSMGGFYGTYAAERYGLPLAMINPAVNPDVLVQLFMGEQINDYTGERYTFTPEHVDIFRSLSPEITQPARYLLLTQTGDETLDYREGIERYRNSPQIVEQGGSHGFDNFEEHLPGIMEFFQTSSNQKNQSA
ncbi:Predicted esterase [gamma proteobacterium HdN1]|nr:Predicted esterase [gamma proteobacterium HdN1]